MKISLEWLSEFVDLPKISSEQLAKQITEHCFEVEKIIEPKNAGLAFSKVYAARVLEWQKHPNADRLRIVKLDAGELGIIEPVVCGAANFDAGDIVALALPSARIPQNIHSEQHETFVLGKAKIRGIESQGMICSAFELGLSEAPEEKPEILILQNIKPGTDLLKHFQGKSKTSANGTVFDLALPANRPDLFSHLGIARELSGILGFKLNKSAGRLTAMPAIKQAKKKLEVAVQNKKDCPYYQAVRMTVQVGPAPEFISKRLQELGLRPINNVVDITNYVMHEMGEPLHAFDAKFVEGKINVRSAESGEAIATIDHKQRILNEGMLVIADSKKALAIAGIMGGVQSEITEATSEIILEAANFDQFSIRRTSKKLGLRTDGSGFWEKGLHIRQAEIGAARALELLQKYAGAKIISSAVVGQPAKIKQNKITFSADDINVLLGTSLKLAEIEKMLSRAAVAVSGTAKLAATPPYYRSDLQTAPDLAEEILKMVGLNKLPKQPLAIQRISAEQNAGANIYRLKSVLSAMGLSEIQSYSFISQKDAEALHYLSSGDLVKVKNPLSSDQAYLRKHLLISMLKNIAANSRHFEEIRIFEIGFGYNGYLDETEYAGIALYSKNQSEELLFAQAKTYVIKAVGQFTNSTVEFSEINRENSQHLQIKIQGQIIGSIKPISAAILQHFEISYPVIFCEMETEKLFKLANQGKKYQPFSTQPQSSLDISINVAQDLPWAEIEQLVRANAGDLLRGIELFEAAYFYPKNNPPMFHRKLAQEGRKNLAFRLIFGAENRTLKDSEISPIYAKIIGELSSKLKAEIR